MGFGVRQRPSSSDGRIFVSYRRIAPQFAIKNVLAQPFQTTKIMMFHVAVGLVQFHRNLRQCIPLNEEKAQGLLLVVREADESSLQTWIFCESVVAILSPTIAVSKITQLAVYVRQVHSCVEMARTQVATSAEGAMIRHLKNPESG